MLVLDVRQLVGQRPGVMVIDEHEHAHGFPRLLLPLFLDQLGSEHVSDELAPVGIPATGSQPVKRMHQGIWERHGEPAAATFGFPHAHLLAFPLRQTLWYDERLNDHTRNLPAMGPRRPPR